MHPPPLFEDLLMILLVSVPVAFACLRLKVPLLVGLMLTGIVIGPYGFGLVKEPEAIEILAEIGVMLLLFTIGLEFSLHRIREMRRLVLIGGGLQVALTVLATALVTVLFGKALNQAIFFGFLVALSSTAIVLKSYAERNEVDAPHGKAGIGILLFQDISIVLMMLLVPVLGGKDEVSLGAIAIKLGGSLLGLVIIIGAAWFLVPLMLRQIVRLKSPEVLLLLVVLLCLGTSFATAQFGLSLALGAFIAGMVLADSDYSHQVTADILPFRDVFNSIFFVSIGMLLSLGALVENLFTVFLWVTLLVIGKALIIWAVIRLLGFPQRAAAMTALGLAQIGEFSFVLAKAGRFVDLLPDSDYQNFLAASIISMIITPFMIAAAPRFGYFIQSILPDKRGADQEKPADEEGLHITSTGGLQNHVIIVGYGLNGRNLARVLRAVQVSYTILDLNAEKIREAKEKDEKINFGDATRREVLHHAAIENANALVLAMSDPHAARRTVKIARELNEKVYIVVRTRYISEITELLRQGADEVIPEEFETSIEIFSRVLLRYGVDRRVIENQIERVRRQGYEMLRSPSIRGMETSNLSSILHSATTETIKLTPVSPVVGKKLGELDLRNITGATLIAVGRDDDMKIAPGANFKLKENDVLILFGKPEQIAQASVILHSEAETGGFNP